MDERLKQRLVGAAVLVSLGAIFIPMLLNIPNAPDETVLGTNIPPKPEAEFSARLVPRHESEKPQQWAVTGGSEEALTSALQPSQTDSRLPAESSAGTSRNAGEQPAPRRRHPAPEHGGPRYTEAAKSKVDGQPTHREAAKAATARSDSGRVGLTAWAVQIGSFSNAQNAIRLTERLRAKGYTAFVESGSSAKGKVARVYVGPELLRDRAVQAAKRLRKELKLKGFVVPYPRG